ncbi:type I restriction enzyme HsdR N-terminal domain-containing protein [Chroococcus sp. FPU101]|uniref:type I restriction enzyme HsdR N-terminal domain-containing protein n=1 Tax=Chroococcus sp. FPU101 TaxID=1974212 RepID=UPI001A90778D|nr:type I restriction enzyme HsdR N-terminal domain-containing protein [Chroococcus sp. FPU101]GFE68709.1 type I restriction enzyme R protein N terminus [Chroococcus sp. FPU101]
MTQTLFAQSIGLDDLIRNFNLKRVEEQDFFYEWQESLPDISDFEKQQLDKVKAGYWNLLDYPPVLEDIVRMTILDPILFIGDFYLKPFYLRSEEPVEIVTEDEGIVIKGRMDTLILKEQFWVMVIEAKKLSYSVEEGVAQILAYMLANPQPEKPNYGMITNGGSFMFIKLVQGTIPQYATSRVYITRNPGNELYDVLRVLKHLTQIVINS